MSAAGVAAWGGAWSGRAGPARHVADRQGSAGAACRFVLRHVGVWQCAAGRSRFGAALRGLVGLGTAGEAGLGLAGCDRVGFGAPRRRVSWPGLAGRARHVVVARGQAGPGLARHGVAGAA